MNATTSHLRQTEVDGPPGREIVELVVQDFEEARRMLAHGYSEMAVVRAVGSFEWLMKQAFLEPYLRTVSLSINGEVATLMIRSLLSPQGWNEMPKLLKACWGIEVGHLPLWGGTAGKYGRYDRRSSQGRPLRGCPSAGLHRDL